MRTGLSFQIPAIREKYREFRSNEATRLNLKVKSATGFKALRANSLRVQTGILPIDIRDRFRTSREGRRNSGVTAGVLSASDTAPANSLMCSCSFVADTSMKCIGEDFGTGSRTLNHPFSVAVLALAPACWRPWPSFRPTSSRDACRWHRACGFYGYARRFAAGGAVGAVPPAGGVVPVPAPPAGTVAGNGEATPEGGGVVVPAG